LKTNDEAGTLKTNDEVGTRNDEGEGIDSFTGSLIHRFIDSMKKWINEEMDQ
jgi:hypothetical protein